MKNKQYERERGRARGFMSGVLLLSLSTLLVKIIGLAFKIPMLSFLGTEGMGYFNSAYEIYALLCVIATAGLPVALSVLVSAARARGASADIKGIYATARGLFLLLGAGGGALMLVFAKPLANAIGNPDAYLCIVAIAPALLFICISSAVRGYCQGFEDMAPTAVSQLIEAISKLLLGILFSVFAIRRGLDVPTVAAFAVLGVTVGTLLSALYLVTQRKRKKFKLTQGDNVAHKKRKAIWRELTLIALPITLGSAILGVTRIIDMTLIMRRLRDIGFSIFEANSIYGAYTTLAVPVFSLVPALITPVSMALVPQLSAYIEEKNNVGQRNVTENAMRLTVLLAMPSSLGLVAFSNPVLELLFKGQNEAISVAAPLLSVLGASVLFSCLITTTNAILQSHRRAHLPIVSMLIGVGVKLLVSYILIGTEGVGALGAPIGSLACNVTVTAINLWFMSKDKSCSFDVASVFFKPMLVSVIALGGALALYVFSAKYLDEGSVLLMMVIAFAALVYFALSFLTGSISAEDIALLPFGERVLRFMNKKKNKEKNKKDREDKNDSCSKETDASRKERI